MKDYSNNHLNARQTSFTQSFTPLEEPVPQNSERPGGTAENVGGEESFAQRFGCRTSRHISLTGFTLVELITVIAIIALLAGMLMPVLASVLRKGKAARTSALIQRIDAALYRYQSDYRDFPASTDGGGGTRDDNISLYRGLTRPGGLNAPYLEFQNAEIEHVVDKDYIILDAWGNLISYCHFTDYDPNWETAQPWRFEKKKYEFQVLSAGAAAEYIDADGNRLIDNSELNNLDQKYVKDIIKNF